MSPSSNDAGEAGGRSILATIKAAASPAEAITAVTKHFIGKLARMLLLSANDLKPDVKSIANHSIDSIIGAELRN